MITGTSIHRVKCAAKNIGKSHDALLKSLTELKNLDHVPAIKYGRETKPTAQQAYLKAQSVNHKNLDVCECGFCISDTLSFVGASPDGLVSCECYPDRLLEIKCPMSIHDKDPHVSELTYVATDNNGEFVLKKNHIYYSQVQLHMGICKRNRCNFFVFTFAGQLTIPIKFDQSYFEELLKANETFSNYFLVPN